MKTSAETAAFAIALTFLTSACSPSARWEHPVLNERYWSYDVDACEGKAWSEAERDLAFRQPIINSPGKWPDRSLARNMARYSVQKEAEGLFATCMKSRGYRLVKTNKEE